MLWILLAYLFGVLNGALIMAVLYRPEPTCTIWFIGEENESRK